MTKKNIDKDIKWNPGVFWVSPDAGDEVWIHIDGPGEYRVKRLLNEGITWEGSKPVPETSGRKMGLKGHIFRNDLKNKEPGMDYVFVSTHGFVLQGTQLPFSSQELDLATDFDPNLSVNETETDPKFGNYYEMIEFYANIRVSKDNPYFGFYENPYLATLQRFTIY